MLDGILDNETELSITHRTHHRHETEQLNKGEPHRSYR